jgi:hypothetical protein
MPKPAREFTSVDDVPWTPVPGNPLQKEKILATDRRGVATRLLRFEPGCRTDAVLTHDFWEEIWILEGSLTDLRLNQTFTAGMYACRPPGMPHGPWVSPDGCTTFEVRYYAQAEEA